MKKILCTVIVCGLSAGFANAQIKGTVVKRSLTPLSAKTKIIFKPVTLSDAKSSDGKIFSLTDIVKTISDKSITVDEYLKRINKIEAEMNQKGYSLRKFKLSENNLLTKPLILDNARLIAANNKLNLKLAPPPLFTTSANGNVTFKIASVKPAGFTSVSNLISTKADILRNAIVKILARKADSVEQVISITELLKPLADTIKASFTSDDASFSFAAADLVVKSVAHPPALKAVNATAQDAINDNNSEYKVSVSFGANAKVSAGLPITINLPLATMNGEFISPSNTTKKLSRRVVVNLLGRSLFNKTSVVNTNTLDEEDSEELDISELMRSVPLSTNDFADYIPTLGFNTDVSTSGAVGCMYSAHMTRSSVDAYIGPTYSVRLRVAASYGLEDIAEGGIEGIITLLKGGLGFGGKASLDFDGSKWRIENTSQIVGTLEALKGEVNFFIRYPDLFNWSCFGPCIVKQTIPIFKTPTAFTLKGTLYQDDKSKILNW